MGFTSSNFILLKKKFYFVNLISINIKSIQKKKKKNLKKKKKKK